MQVVGYEAYQEKDQTNRSAIFKSLEKFHSQLSHDENETILFLGC